MVDRRQPGTLSGRIGRIVKLCKLIRSIHIIKIKTEGRTIYILVMDFEGRDSTQCSQSVGRRSGKDRGTNDRDPETRSIIWNGS